jgi:hypothetical protein
VSAQDARVEPFTIRIDDALLDDLRDRLSRTRWPDEADGAGWTLGTDLTYLKNVAEYWRDGFDWRRVEAHLNSYPQFTATIDGQRIHFVHVRAPGSNDHALPLILTHGWPSTFAELLPLVGPLTDPTAHRGDASDAFDVVIPSLPGAPTTCGRP